MNTKYHYRWGSTSGLFTESEIRTNAQALADEAGTPVAVQVKAVDLNRWFPDFTCHPRQRYILSSSPDEKGVVLHGPFTSALKTADVAALLAPPLILLTLTDGKLTAEVAPPASPVAVWNPGNAPAPPAGYRYTTEAETGKGEDSTLYDAPVLVWGKFKPVWFKTSGCSGRPHQTYAVPVNE